VFRYVSTSERVFKIFVRNVEIKTQTYEEKAAAIREVGKGLKTKCLIAKEFDIPLNTLSTYHKNKEKIFSKLATSGKKGRKMAREPENPDVCFGFFG